MVNIDQFLQLVIQSSTDNIHYCYRQHDTYYFWIDQKSTRGVDISFGHEKIEIKNTTLSNPTDLLLTNILVEILLQMVDGTIVNEAEEYVALPIFTEEIIREICSIDAHTLLRLSQTNEEVTIYGPIRKTYFGKSMYKRLVPYENQLFVLAEKIEEVILKVQYQLPDYEYGNVLEVQYDAHPLVMKLLTNKTNCIVDKYDYILIEGKGKAPLMITNAVLNKIQPESWSLVDAYTMVAPRVTTSEWNAFVTRAAEFDQFENFKQKKADS
ncbi:hypothetical protein SAMN05216480_1278 [Pustulibacterium marinum]|uniref:Uncharacterized protein n=2 Tax=Pustulibacterium marinum TaxID=1224947 RepID=A0A1I7IZU2_9FLAO|nr:hypothetical protein SAMN05216480_1278 [Pustulibacterium marinum]